MRRITTQAILIALCFGFVSTAAARRPAANVASNRLWVALGAYQHTHLKAWREALTSSESPTALDVLDAYNEMAYAVTGVAGFWRKTLPSQWLGCTANADTEACVALDKSAAELTMWDGFQKKIERISTERAAVRFLKRNEKQMTAYLNQYVPVRFAASEVKETGYFQSHLAASMQDL